MLSYKLNSYKGKVKCFVCTISRFVPLKYPNSLSILNVIKILYYRTLKLKLEHHRLEELGFADPKNSWCYRNTELFILYCSIHVAFSAMKNEKQSGETKGGLITRAGGKFELIVLTIKKSWFHVGPIKINGPGCTRWDIEFPLSRHVWTGRNIRQRYGCLCRVDETGPTILEWAPALHLVESWYVGVEGNPNQSIFKLWVFLEQALVSMHNSLQHLPNF